MEYFLFAGMGFLISTFADLKKIMDLKKENEELIEENKELLQYKVQVLGIKALD